MWKRALFMTAGFAATVFTGCQDGTTFYSNVLRSDVYYQVYSISNIDFLMVVDTSLTMQPKNVILANQLQNFVNILTSRKAVDYQLAFTTVDLFTDACELLDTNGDGSGVKVVKSTDLDPVGETKSILSNLVYAVGTSFWEQGLECAYQATKNYGSQFSRPGVPLGIAFFSDEEDYSCKDGCFGIQPEDNTGWVPWPTSRYISYFSELKKAESTVVSMFPVVALNFDDCTVPSLGTRYITVADAVTEAYEPGTTAQTGSVCHSSPEDESLIAQSFRGIAQNVSDRGLVFKLSSASSGTGINVFVNGELIPFSSGYWAYDSAANSVTFIGSYAPPLNAVVEVTYSQDVL